MQSGKRDKLINFINYANVYKYICCSCNLVPSEPEQDVSSVTSIHEKRRSPDRSGTASSIITTYGKKIPVYQSGWRVWTLTENFI